MSAEETSFAGDRPAIKPASEAVDLLLAAHWDRWAKVHDISMLTAFLGHLAGAADESPAAAGIVVEAVTAAIALNDLRGK